MSDESAGVARSLAQYRRNQPKRDVLRIVGARAAAYRLEGHLFSALGGSVNVRRISIFVVALLAIHGVAAAMPAKYLPAGTVDFNHGSSVLAAGGAATSDKPESKLFFTSDNRWWAVLGTSSGSQGAGAYLYELVDHSWRERMLLPQSDPWMRADTLLVGQRLYVALRDNRSLTGNARQSLLYRLTYDGSGRWSPPPQPTPITRVNVEALTLALDSQGRLWTAFRRASGGEQVVTVGHTQPGGTAFTLETLATVNSDDLAAVTSFSGASGPRIGVMWSDHPTRAFRFAWRSDSDPMGSWKRELAYGRGLGCPLFEACTDDHLNVTSHNGRIYAAVKTNRDVSSPVATDPLIVLLRRDTDGTWRSFPVSPVSDDATRPVVLLSPGTDRVYVFASHKGVSVWESSLSSPSFSSTNRTQWTATGTANPTTTKQPVTPSSGAVVETSNRSKLQYWHNEFPPG
jgi:hypothetical protein